jgi:hypothetical protein
MASELLQWFKQESGSLHSLQLQYIDEEQGLSLIAEEEIAAGTQVMTIPLKCCMTIESALQNELSCLAQESSSLPTDELLALYLMSEKRKGQSSRYAEYIK